MKIRLIILILSLHLKAGSMKNCESKNLAKHAENEADFSNPCTKIYTSLIEMDKNCESSLKIKLEPSWDFNDFEVQEIFSKDSEKKFAILAEIEYFCSKIRLY